MNDLMSLNFTAGGCCTDFIDQNLIVEQCYRILRQPMDQFCAYGSVERLMDVIGNDYERDFVRAHPPGEKWTGVFTELGTYGNECSIKRDLESEK